MSGVPELCDLASHVRRAQDDCGTLAPFGDRLDLATAYGIADRVHRQRLAQGAVPAGRKIGFTNRGIWDEYGVRQPIWGWMYAHTVVRARHGEADLRLAPYAEPRIEPEIALHFAKAPPRGADAAALLGCIDWVAHGFEIVQSHYPGWKFGVADTIADGGLHGALVLGETVPVTALGPDPAAALAAFEIDLACGGVRRETGRGANVLDGPLSALAHLAALLATAPETAALRAGEVVTTGTLTAAYPVHPGETWSTVLRGIPLPGLVLRLLD